VFLWGFGIGVKCIDMSPPFRAGLGVENRCFCGVLE
jgi:hypothetical protein